MTRATAAVLLCLLIGTGASWAQSSSADPPPSLDQRADALLGLGRVARDRSNWRDAYARFVESRRLRPLSSPQLSELFWIAFHADPAEARRIAAELAARRGASRDVFTGWITLARQAEPPAVVLAIVEQAAAAFPADPAWTDTRATMALRAERDRRDDLAAAAWAAIPTLERESRADWHASFLRVSAARGTRASLAPEIDRFVRAHPEDLGMRRLAVEAWADAGQPLRGLGLLEPLAGPHATGADLRRAADLARQAGAHTRARALLERLVASPAATDADTWTLAELLAASRDAAALRRLFAGHPPGGEQPCRDRLVTVAIAAGDDTLLTDVVPSLPESCPMYGAVASRIAIVQLERDRPADAERWLAPLARAGTLDEPSQIALARALAARHAWADVDALLSAMVRDRTDAQAREAARVLVWAWHAQARSVEAWRLSERLLSPATDRPVARAGWAAMALAAGDEASATLLADSALGTSRDTDARAVLAALAMRAGHPREALRWLEPVRRSLTEPGHVLLLVDAVEAIEGAAAARDAVDDHAGITAGDPILLERRALWSATIGDVAGAAVDAARVRTLAPARADRLDVAVLLASGQGDAAWTRLASVSPGTAMADASAWLRLRLDAALATGRWDEGSRLLAEAGGVLTDADAALTTARLVLGRDGTLGPEHRIRLTELVTSDTHARAAALILAADEIAHRAYGGALARLSTLGGASLGATAPADVRALQAEALLGLGRADQALVITAASLFAPPALQVLRARAQRSLGQVAQARATVEHLVRATGRADALLAWADLAETPDARVAVLADARMRHPDDVRVRAHYADALWRAGDGPAARAEAEAVLRRAPRSREAWRVVAAVEAAQRATTLVSTLDRARAELGGDPDDVLLLVGAITQVPHPPDQAVDLASGWLAALPASHALAGARATAALGVTAGRWPMASAAVARLRILAPDDSEVQRLEAEVTAWSGHHNAAVPLFERYLDREPADVSAWRQFARLLSWMGDRVGAERAYGRAQALSPDRSIAAEARTRLSILRRDWPEAVAAASQWRALEPDRLDASVDLALALDQADDAAGAARAYEELSHRAGLPDTVHRTIAAFEWRRAPHAVGAFELEHVDGFGGRRLLERRETALSGDAAVSGDGAVRVYGRLGQGRLDTGPSESGFTQGRAGLRTWLGHGITADAHLGATTLSTGEAMLGGVQVGARVTRHVGLEVASARRPFWENDATIRTGVQAWTSGVRLRLLGGGVLDASAGADYAVLSDGNRRAQADVSVGRQIHRGVQQWDVRASAFIFRFDQPSPVYFSPSAFGRLDVELGVMQWYGRGAAVRDGRFAVRGRFGSGVDTAGKPYLLGGGSFVLPLAGRLALTGEARLTAASTYRAWSGTVGVRVGARDEPAAMRTR